MTAHGLLPAGTHESVSAARLIRTRRARAVWRRTTQVTAAELRDRPPNVVLLQRLEEIELCAELLGLRLGRDLPAIYLEHNTPKTDVPSTRHPLADAPEMP
jgi:hypothetical protein